MAKKRARNHRERDERLADEELDRLFSEGGQDCDEEDQIRVEANARLVGVEDRLYQYRQEHWVGR